VDFLPRAESGCKKWGIRLTMNDFLKGMWGITWYHCFSATALGGFERKVW
jgi:hypothetical protein